MPSHQAKRRDYALGRVVFVYALFVAVILLQLPVRAAAQSSELVPIYAIQGSGKASPLVARRVDTFGVVTGLTPDGFYLQDPDGDGNPFTSDGIYVFTYQPPTDVLQGMQPGACVEVRNALVQEYYGKTELNWVDSVETFAGCSTNGVKPIVLPDLWLGDDAAAHYERWEGMVVEVSSLDGIVHGPTERYESGEAEIAFLPTYLQQAVPFGRILRTSQFAHANGADPLAGGSLQYLSSLLGGDLPNADWGDRILAADDGASLRAVLDFNFGKYQLLLLPGENVRTLSSKHLPEDGAAPSALGFTVCTYNVHGLGTGRAQYKTAQEYEAALAKAAHVIAAPLKGCTIVALQETGTPTDASALARRLRDAYGMAYESIAILGPMSSDPEFPLTNSFLVRNESVRVLDSFTVQECSPRDYEVAAVRGERCPVGQYPLFNRPPLVVDLLISGEWGDGVSLRLINNHWKSKAGDEEVNAARRALQSEAVAKIVAASRSSGVKYVIVLGDLNDFEDSAPLRQLTKGDNDSAGGLVNTWDYLTKSDRYSFIFNGFSQVLDHILITSNMVQSVSSIDAVHINADWSECIPESNAGTCQASDHDPLMIHLRPGGAAALGGELGFADIDVVVTHLETGNSARAVTGPDGGFRVWDMLPGKMRVHYSAPKWLGFEDAITGEIVQELVTEVELGTGISLLEVPKVELLPAMYAAEDASMLIDALQLAK